MRYDEAVYEVGSWVEGGRAHLPGRSAARRAQSVSVGVLEVRVSREPAGIVSCPCVW